MIPFLLWGATIVTAGYGAKKIYNANEKNEKAKKIVRKAKRKYKNKLGIVELKRGELNNEIETFAKFKLGVYRRDIANVIKLAKKCTNVSSSFHNKRVIFSRVDLEQMQKNVELSTEIVSGLFKGGVSGVLTAYGIYGSATLFGTASTGTAIATLSGIAARNAALSWLGGGSLAAGGAGIAGGMAMLSGMFIAPLIAVLGSHMDSQAEENLTKAKEYELEVDIQVEKLQTMIENMNIVKRRIYELKNVIEELIDILNNKYNDFAKLQFKSSLCQNKNFIEYLYIAKKLKEALEIDIMDRQGNLSLDFEIKLERVRL